MVVIRSLDITFIRVFGVWIFLPDSLVPTFIQNEVVVAGKETFIQNKVVVVRKMCIYFSRFEILEHS